MLKRCFVILAGVFLVSCGGDSSDGSESNGTTTPNACEDACEATETQCRDTCDNTGSAPGNSNQSDGEDAALLDVCEKACGQAKTKCVDELNAESGEGVTLACETAADECLDKCKEAENQASTAFDFPSSRTPCY